MNSKYFLILLLSIIFLSQSGFSQIPTNGLIGYWPFSGNADDESGNGNHGTLHGGVSLTTDRFGFASRAYEFDGVDDFITLLPSDLVYTQFTVSGWFLFNNSTNNHAIGSYSINDEGWAWKMYNGNVRISVGGSTGLSSTALLNTGTWYQVTITNDGFFRNIYINGLINASDIGTPSMPGDSIVIGAVPKYLQTQFNWDGKIDEIRIYNRPLSLNEINSIFITDLSEKNESVFQAYPNPAKETIIIENKDRTEFTLEVFNLNGEKIRDLIKQSGSVKLDISDLKKGIYIYKTYSKENIITGKFIKD